MSETIKASEITPGMVVGWTDSDVYTRILVESYNPSISAVRSVSGAIRYLSSDTEVEVVSSSPLIPEPMSLGARVKAGNKLFLRISGYGYPWLEVTGGANDLEYTWKEVNEFGPVTIIEGDPSWDTETAADADSDQWDDIETALKHCDRVIDKDGDPWFYLDGGLHVTILGTAMKWLHSIDAANDSGPFRRS